MIVDQAGPASSRGLAQVLAGFTAACYAATPGAQGTAVYPQRNVQIVVPYTPGTGADIVARMLGPRLAERWNVGVIADNRPGATGNIGADFVAKAVPDGHILLMTATSFCTTPALSAKLPFDPVKSFAPVIQVAASELILVVHPWLPANPIRRVGDHGIDLAERRQYLAAVAEVQRRGAYGLDPTHHAAIR